MFALVNVLKGRLWDDECQFDVDKNKEQFRNYESACDRVKNFYKEQHGTPTDIYSSICIPYAFITEKQTVDFNIQARVEFKRRTRARMGIWEAMEKLNTLVDESDPDVSHDHLHLFSSDLLFRPQCHRSNICFRRLKLFESMGSLNGCRYV